MKNSFRIITVLFLMLPLAGLPLLFSCSDGHNAELDKMTAERDSLQALAQENAEQLTNMTAFFDSVASCIDSIAAQEQLIYITINPETGRNYSRRELRARVDMFKDILTRQRNKIAELTAQLGSDTIGDPSHLSRIVEYLNAQLEAKEQQVARLQSELANSRTETRRLQNSVRELEQGISELQEANAAMGEALTVQSEIVNEGYVKIGTKQELLDCGVLTGGGFLRKARLNVSAFSGANFAAVNIAYFTEIDLNAKKAKILTQMPAGSYTLQKVADRQWKLRITDPTAFWSVSNYLVIQLDQ